MAASVVVDFLIFFMMTVGVMQNMSFRWFCVINCCILVGRFSETRLVKINRRDWRQLWCDKRFSVNVLKAVGVFLLWLDGNLLESIDKRNGCRMMDISVMKLHCYGDSKKLKWI